MEDAFARAIQNLNDMEPDRVNSNAQRRFKSAVELPLARHLGLDNSGQRENVYVTWVGTSNNIDNRLWQVQNKLIKGSDPRFAFALCEESILNDGMWVDSAKILSQVSPYLGEHTFQGIVLVATADNRSTFKVRRLILLRNGELAVRIAADISEIDPEYYDVPLSARRLAAPGSSHQANEVRELITAYRNVVLEGVAGIGKSHLFAALASDFGASNIEVAVFHPQSQYEDFVEGLRPTPSKPGAAASLQTQDGRFLSFCRKAAANPEESFLFIIDEINRASPARVLGDLLYSIEPSKRVHAVAANAVLSLTDDDAPLPISMQGQTPPTRLQFSRFNSAGKPYHQLFCVPDNLFILGTMNTSDHSIGGVDLALRRRFVFRRMEPLGPSELKAALHAVDDRYRALSVEVDAWQSTNAVLATVAQDAQLGHSYFFEATEAAARARVTDVDSTVIMLWRDLILPQLASTLVSFDALHLLENLDSSVTAAGSTSGGYWLESVGSGVDAVPVVVPRGSAIPAAVPPQSPPSGASGDVAGAHPRIEDPVADSSASEPPDNQTTADYSASDITAS